MCSNAMVTSWLVKARMALLGFTTLTGPPHFLRNCKFETTPRDQRYRCNLHHIDQSGSYQCCCPTGFALSDSRVLLSLRCPAPPFAVRLRRCTSTRPASSTSQVATREYKLDFDCGHTSAVAGPTQHILLGSALAAQLPCRTRSANKGVAVEACPSSDCRV
jgi:hypothetical protein